MESIERYKIANWAYSIGKDFISDAEWERLYAIMPEDVRAVWWQDMPCPVELLCKYGYESWIREVVLSSEKSSSIPSIINMQEFYDAYPKDVGHKYHISVKMDGWNTQIHYRKGKRVIARSRGRATEATLYFKLTERFPESINLPGETLIAGELVMSWSNFAELQRRHPEKNLTSIRHSVSSALSDENDLDLLDFIAFNITGEYERTSVSQMFRDLKSYGFDVPVGFEVDEYTDLLMEIEDLSKYALSSYPYKTDGCVVRSTNANDYTLSAVRLFGWARDYYKSFVSDYIYAPGPQYMAMKVEIYPVRRNDGAKQRQLDVDNLARIKELNLRKNSPVAWHMVSDSVEEIDVEITKSLQIEFAGRFDEYVELIVEEERLKNEWTAATLFRN